jgi:hypothetical protein
MTTERRYRAGETIEDVCRACKADRLHTVVVVDGSGRPIRVTCDYCHSEHNYRGGPADRTRSSPSPGRQPSGSPAAAAFPVVGERERVMRASAHQEADVAAGPPTGMPSSRMLRPGESAKAESTEVRLKPDATMDTTNEEISGQSMNQINADDLEVLLRRIIREEAGVTPVVPAPKWRGGTLVLRPGSPGLQEKTWPIETFFHKIVMVRNRLRTLEQQINASELPDDVKVKLQAYVSGCYGSLTSFNVLFAAEEDQFKGAGGD